MHKSLASHSSMSSTLAKSVSMLPLSMLVPIVMLGLESPASADETLTLSAVHIPSTNSVNPGDTGVRAHTNVRYIIPSDTNGPLKVGKQGASPKVLGGPPYSGYYFETPASLACEYHLLPQTAGCNPNAVTTPVNTGSKVIAIVDAYDYPTAQADLTAFSQQFNLPLPTSSNFSVVYATGTKPGVDPTEGWEIEEALDISMAHAMAPNAKIILVEAASSSLADLQTAINVAKTQVQAAGGGEVSMSWGLNEWSGEVNYDSWFNAPSVVFTASTGDAPGTSWPSVSPNVIAAGGTTTSHNVDTGVFQGNFAWSESGGGTSSFEGRPSYQGSQSKIVGTHRGVPDISFDADPDTGAWVVYNNSWYIIGGTSLSAPALAGVINSSGTFRSSTSAEQTYMYNHIGQFTKVHNFFCGPYGGYLASYSYNFCVGVGVPNGGGAGL